MTIELTRHLSDINEAESVAVRSPYVTLGLVVSYAA